MNKGNNLISVISENESGHDYDPEVLDDVDEPTQLERIFTDEEIENIKLLGRVLFNIRTRLISEGQSIDELRKHLDEKIQSEKSPRPI